MIQKPGKIPVKYHVFLFVFLTTLMLVSNLRPYNYNFSFLIGIQKEFYELNKPYFPNKFVILEKSGYDGQFFYLTARYLYSDLSAPVMDTFRLRFNRLGLPLLTGLLSFPTHFKLYPEITFSLLCFFHLLSFYILYNYLQEKQKLYSLFYLFSPFTINSDLLLVSDSFFASIFILCFVPILKMYQEKKDNSFSIFLIIILLSYFSLIRETALFVSVPFSIYLIYTKRRKLFFYSLIPILVYISFFAYTYFILSQHPETNPPPSVFKLLDFPFLGLLKSLSMDLSSNPKIIVKQLSKLPIPIYFILLIFNIYNITSIQRFILFLPLLAIIGLAAISEKDYWDSFDNISRMFTLTGPIIILFKNKMENYKDFYVLHAGALIYLLVLIRFIAIKQGMTFFLSNIHLH